MNSKLEQRIEIAKMIERNNPKRYKLEGNILKLNNAKEGLTIVGGVAFLFIIAGFLLAINVSVIFGLFFVIFGIVLFAATTFEPHIDLMEGEVIQKNSFNDYFTKKYGFTEIIGDCYIEIRGTESASSKLLVVDTYTSKIYLGKDENFFVPKQFDSLFSIK